TIIAPNNQNGESSQWGIKTYGKPQLFDNVDFNSAVLLTRKDQFWWGVGANAIFIMDEPKNKDTIIPPTYITGIDIMEQQQYFSNTRLFQKKSGTMDTIWS